MFKEVGAQGSRRVPDWWIVTRSLPPTLALALIGPVLVVSSLMFDAGAWLLWIGLLITVVGLIVLRWLTRRTARVRAKSDRLVRNGRRGTAEILKFTESASSESAGPPMMHLRIFGDGFATFDAKVRWPLHPAANAMARTGVLAVVVDPGTREFAIDWRATEYLGTATNDEIDAMPIEGLFAATGTLDTMLRVMRDARTLGVDGRDIDPSATTDVLNQILRESGAGAMPTNLMAARLAELDALYRAGRIADAEFRAARARLLGEL